MKTLLTILFSLLITPLFGTNYYVSPTGNNANAGTIGSPWATFQYAFDYALQPGDTVFFRGGIYETSSTQFLDDLDGTEGSPICFFNYPGEHPIMDGLDRTSPSGGITVRRSSFFEFRGITVRNILQINAGYVYATAYHFYYATDFVIDQCIAHHCGYRGFFFQWSERFLVKNCDAYEIADPLSADPGDAGDGFIVTTASFTPTGTATFRGCRAWRCSDDGWDVEMNGLIELDSCWAFNNGYEEFDGEGLGNGFKLQLSASGTASVLNRKVTNCIAAHVRRSGFTTNDRLTSAKYMQFYNNISYANGKYGQAGYGFRIYNTNSSDADERMRIFTNNIAYANTTTNFSVAADALYTSVTNSWDGGVTVTDDDFVSVDSTGLAGARQANGTLPILDFLKLVEGSDLIDAGTDVGLSYVDSAPDLGYYEYSSPFAETGTDITTFSFAEQTGLATINPTTHTVAIEVDYTANVTNLTPTITLSYGATVIPLSGVARDFTSPLPYTVTAEDGITIQEWTVTVTQEAEPEEPPVYPEDSLIIRYNGKIIRL